MNRATNRRTSIVLLLACFLGVTGRVEATTYAVDDPADAVDDNLIDVLCHTAAGHCSLRAAIQNANKDLAADTITVPPGVYTLAIAGTGENASAAGDLDLLYAVSVIGTGAKAADVVIDGAAIDRIFHVFGPAPTTIERVRITGGLAYDGVVGGIYNSNAVLTVRDSEITCE